MMNTTGLVLASLALLVSTACGSEPVELQPDGPYPSENPSTELPTPAPATSATYGEESVVLSFAGDVHFEGGLTKLLDQPSSAFGAATRAALSRADYTMVNLESAITTRGTKDPKNLEEPGLRYHFRTDERALRLLDENGVDVVTVANNHGADFGTVGLQDTLAARDRSALPIVGVGRNIKDAFSAHEVTIKGTDFAFFGADASFLESRASTWRAGPKNPGLASARGSGREYLLKRVEAAKNGGSVPVVYLHWGDEGNRCVTGGQASMATDLRDAGAAIVVGSHTHVLQASGYLKGFNPNSPTTYVSYGLGNFVWYHGSIPDSGILNLTVKGGQVVNENWAPALIPRYGGTPVMRTGSSKAAALKRWKGLRSCGRNVESQEVHQTPEFSMNVSAIDSKLAKRMESSYAEGCPTPLSDLRHMELPHYDYSGKVQAGELIVHRKQVGKVANIFNKLYDAKYPIARMDLVSDFGGDDGRSMAANNTSGFNCRTVAGTDRWSNHAYGAAIDINPIQNPYVSSAGVQPAAGKRFAYVDRSGKTRAAKGVIVNKSVIVRAFRAEGWVWGNTFQDYQHFSANGG